MNNRHFSILGIGVIIIVMFLGVGAYIALKWYGAPPPSTPTPTSSRTESGSFEKGIIQTLHYEDRTKNPTYNIDNPYLSIVEVHFTWAELEPNESEYHWADLDQFLQQWGAKGKRVIPSITLYSAGGANPTNNQATPQWVFDAGADYITLTDTDTRKQLVWPVPWDRVFLQKYKNFVQAFGQRYDGHQAIESIDIGLGLFATTRLVLRNPQDAAAKFIAKGFNPYTKQPWMDTILTVTRFYEEGFETTPLRMTITHFTNCRAVSQALCKSVENDNDNDDDSTPQISILAKEAASRGITIHYHNLMGTDRFLERPWLRLYEEIHAQYPRTKTSLGTDNLTNNIARYGRIRDVVRYAFGGDIPGKGVYPESHISYLSLYADDIARSTPGSLTYDTEFAKAMRYTVDRLVKNTTSISQKIPRGIFSLTRADDPIADQIFTNPSIAGVTLRSNWKKIEKGIAEGPPESTSDGIIYDWSYFDSEIARVDSLHAAGVDKKILLRITSGGINTPRRVLDEGVRTFTLIDTNAYHSTFNKPVTIPVFWDPVFLEHKKRFITAMGKHFASNPNIVLVSSSCANANTDDWHIPNEPEDIENWKKVGYTNEKVINACKEIIDATMSAFPNTFVLMAMGGNPIIDQQDPIYVARKVIEYARERYPGRFFPQNNRLSARTPDPTETSTLNQWQLIYDARPQVGAQMLWRVTDDPGCRMEGGKNPSGDPCKNPAATLRRAITTGGNYQTQYQEIYEIDVINPNLAEVIRYAADLLTHLPSSPNIHRSPVPNPQSQRY